MEPSNRIITYYSDKKHRSMATRDRRMPETDRPIDQPNEVCPWKYLHILNLCLPTKSWVFGSIPLKVRKWADGLLCFFLFRFRWWKLRLITKSQNDEKTTKTDSVHKTSPLPFRGKGNSVQNYWVGSTFSRRSLPNTASKVNWVISHQCFGYEAIRSEGKIPYHWLWYYSYSFFTHILLHPPVSHVILHSPRLWLFWPVSKRVISKRWFYK